MHLREATFPSLCSVFYLLFSVFCVLRSAFWILLSAFCFLPLPHSVYAAQEPDPEIVNAVAIRVNGDIVSLTDVEGLFADSWRLIQERVQRGELKPAGWPQALREAWTGALQTAVQDALLDQLGVAKRQEIIRSIVGRSEPTTAPSRMMDSFRRLEGDLIRSLRREMVQAAGGEKEMRAALARKGQTLEQWEAGLQRELFRREVLFSSVGLVVDSPAAAKAYFDAHPEKFRRDDAWQLRRIRIPKAKFATPEAAAQAAALVRAKLNEGQDFAALAAALRYDPPYDAQGGMLTVNNLTGLPSGNFPAEERIAAKLEDGGISDVVDAGEAFLIVKREGYRPAVVHTFEQAAEQAAALAYTERVKRKKEEFFERQKKDAFIEILIREPPEKYVK